MYNLYVCCRMPERWPTTGEFLIDFSDVYHDWSWLHKSIGHELRSSCTCIGFFGRTMEWTSIKVEEIIKHVSCIFIRKYFKTFEKSSFLESGQVFKKETRPKLLNSSYMGWLWGYPVHMVWLGIRTWIFKLNRFAWNFIIDQNSRANT